MVFQLFGSRSSTETFLRFPVCSAEQPARILQEFARAWKTYRHSTKREKVRQDSQPKRDPRISKQIHRLRQRAERGKWAGGWVDADTINWYQLSRADQDRCLEYQRGDIQHQIVELQNQQEPRFEGAASFMMRH